MTENLKKAVGLTSYFISLPPAKYFLFAILLLGIFFGAIIAFIGGQHGPELLIKGVLQGFFVLTIPAFLTAVVVKTMMGEVPFRRIVAITFAGEVIYAITYLIAFILPATTIVSTEAIIFIGAALVFGLWYTVARVVFTMKWRAFVFAMVQLLFHALFLFSSQFMIFSADLFSVIMKFYIASFLLLIGIYLLFMIINAPMKRNFGFSSMEMASLFLAQWFAEKRDMERAFEKVGEEVETTLSFISFNRKHDRIFFVTPYVHYGPFGNLGGSEFSYLLAEELRKNYGARTFVFHGTVTHDLNPVSSSELSNIMKACAECVRDNKPQSTKIAYAIGRKEECMAEGLFFGDHAFIGLSRAPETTEDINYGAGLALMAEAEKTIPLVTLVDQHNSETGEVTSFEPGNPIVSRYSKAVAACLKSPSRKKARSLKVGISERAVMTPFVGKAGVKIAIFSTNPPYVLILIDANGITPAFRSSVMEEVVKLGEIYGRKWNVGIYTTDTHQVNVVKGVLNPLKDEETVMREIKAGVVEAMFDMQDATVYACKRPFRISVLGAKQSIEIVSTVNSIIAVTRIVAPLIIFGSIIVILWILMRI